jgi:hypothetical protein
VEPVTDKKLIIFNISDNSWPNISSLKSFVLIFIIIAGCKKIIISFYFQNLYSGNFIDLSVGVKKLPASKSNALRVGSQMVMRKETQDLWCVWQSWSCG